LIITKNIQINIYKRKLFTQQYLIDLTLGFHLTFDIDEKKINNWLTHAGFLSQEFLYQNYITHDIVPDLDKKDFIICIARKF
jgi:hypothetical protein